MRSRHAHAHAHSHVDDPNGSAAPHFPLFPEALPRLPTVLAGYQAGDEVWLKEGTARTRARVICVLRRRHLLVLRTACHRPATVNPITHPTTICKRSGE